MNDNLEAALSEAAAGDAPETIALMRVLMEASSEAEARTGLNDAMTARDGAAAARLKRLQLLWDAHPDAWSTIRTVIDAIAHDRSGGSPADTIRYLADTFDRLAAASPEGSVALYSLGSPALLAAATAEVVARMSGWDLLGPHRDALDLGCGIGRFLQALAPRVRTVTGLDISPRMVAEAQARCGALRNVTVAQGSGHDLAQIEDGCLDLVLAADVFPYLVQAGGGLVATHIAECARVLRPGGRVLILNYSYRGDVEADRGEVAAIARHCGFEVERNGTHELELWDAAAFLLRLPLCKSRAP